MKSTNDLYVAVDWKVTPIFCDEAGDVGFEMCLTMSNLDQLSM